MRWLAPLLMLLALAGASPPIAQGAPPFAACSTCHSLEKGVTLIGPTLWGVYGRRKASAPGYDYSPALKVKGGVWKGADLDTVIASPIGYAPGTKMVFGGISEALRRSTLIAFPKKKR